MNPIYIIILVIAVAGAAFYGVTAYQKSQQPTGTGENQQAISIGDNNQPTNSDANAVNGKSDRSGDQEEDEMPISGNPCGGTEGLGEIVSDDTPQVKTGDKVVLVGGPKISMAASLQIQLQFAVNQVRKLSQGT